MSRLCFCIKDFVKNDIFWTQHMSTEYVYSHYHKASFISTIRYIVNDMKLLNVVDDTRLANCIEDNCKLFRFIVYKDTRLSGWLYGSNPVVTSHVEQRQEIFVQVSLGWRTLCAYILVVHFMGVDQPCQSSVRQHGSTMKTYERMTCITHL